MIELYILLYFYCWKFEHWYCIFAKYFVLCCEFDVEYKGISCAVQCAQSIIFHFDVVNDWCSFYVRSWKHDESVRFTYTRSYSINTDDDIFYMYMCDADEQQIPSSKQRITINKSIKIYNVKMLHIFLFLFSFHLFMWLAASYIIYYIFISSKRYCITNIFWNRLFTNLT